MNKILLSASALLVTTLLLTPIQAAAADCSNAESDALLSCADEAVNTCRDLYPTCIEPGRAVTVQDTLDTVGAKCCAISGRRTAGRQRSCFLSSERKLTAMLRVAEPSLKKFLRKTKSAITALRKDGCTTGSL